MADLLNNYEQLPIEVQNVLNSFDYDKELYQECQRVCNELKVLGYNAEYDLSGELTSLTKIKVHKLTNNFISYPNFHIWRTNPNKLNILSNSVIEAEHIIVINRTRFKIVSSSHPKKVTDMELLGTNNISEQTKFYECIISKL